MKRFLLAVLLLAVLVQAANSQTPGQTLYPNNVDNDYTLLMAADAVSTYLTAAISATDTQLHVAGITDFPDACVVQIGTEMLVVSISSQTTLSVVSGVAGRGFARTIAAPHPANATVRVIFIAAHIHGLRSAVIALEQRVGTGSSIPIAAGEFLAAQDSITGNPQSIWRAIQASDLSNAGILSGDGPPSGSCTRGLLYRNTATNPQPGWNYLNFFTLWICEGGDASGGGEWVGMR